MKHCEIEPEKLCALLLSISEAMHNHGSEYFAKKSFASTDMAQKVLERERAIGTFFALTRYLANALSGQLHVDEALFDEIINFIEEDFNDFCHHNTDFLDIGMFEKLVMRVK